MAAPSLTTELEVLNAMLATIGETPVDQTEYDTPTSAYTTVAKAAILEVSKDVQAAGWYWNTQQDVTLTPDESDNITVTGLITGATVFLVDLDHEFRGDYEVVLRGSDLFDIKNNQDTFAIPLTCQVQYYLEFTSLPEEARRYISVRASRVFQARCVGSETLFGFTQRDEYAALANLRRSSGMRGDPNMLNEPRISAMLAKRS